MGTHQDQTIIVTGGMDKDSNDYIKGIHKKAKKIFNKPIKDGGETLYDIDVVSKIKYGVMNGVASFFIAPDGSKEGWHHSNVFDKRISKFMELTHGKGYEVVHISYGELGCDIMNREDYCNGRNF